MVMKKYLRVALEVLLAVLLVAAMGLAYWSFAGKKHVVHDLAELNEQLEEAQESLEKAKEEAEASKEKMERLEFQLHETDAIKSAFANGVVLQDIETLYKAQKSLSTERQVGLAAMRLLTKGAEDPETVEAFQKSLEMAEWSSRLQTVCAAQNALVAAGKKVELLSECQRKPGAKEEPGHGKKEVNKKDSHAKKGGGHDVHWGYEGDHGPEHWGDNFPVCAKGKKTIAAQYRGPV